MYKRGGSKWNDFHVAHRNRVLQSSETVALAGARIGGRRFTDPNRGSSCRRMCWCSRTVEGKEVSLELEILGKEMNGVADYL